MNRLTEWIGEGEDRHAIPRMDLRKNGHQAYCNKLAEYEDLEETGMISKWIPVKWHVILDAEREEEGIPDDIVYYLDCPMPEDGEEIIVTDGKRVWTDENCIDIVGHCLESGNDWKDIKTWIPLPERYKGIMEEDRYIICAVKQICVWMITATTILIAMKWTGSAWCLWAFCIPAILE